MLPADEPPRPARDVSRRSSFKAVSAYVPRKSKRQKATERDQRKKLWQRMHVEELIETKRHLFRAIRLLRQNKVELPPELAKLWAQHEAAEAKRKAKRKKFEVKPA